jgi:hypothetical protein
MAKLRAIPGGKRKEKHFSLVYGLRLYPAGTVAQVKEGQTLQQDGSESRVTLHLIEGTREQIRAQLLASIDAFFDIYGDESVPVATPVSFHDEDLGEAGC